MNQAPLRAVALALASVGIVSLSVSPSFTGAAIGAPESIGSLLGFVFILAGSVLFAAAELSAHTSVQSERLKAELDFIEKHALAPSGLSQGDPGTGVYLNAHEMKEISDIIETELPTAIGTAPARAYVLGSLNPKKAGIRSKKLGEATPSLSDVKYITDVDVCIVSDTLMDLIRKDYSSLVKQDGKKGAPSANRESTIELRDERFSLRRGDGSQYELFDDQHTQEELPPFMRRIHDHLQSQNIAGRDDRPLNIRVFSTKGALQTDFYRRAEKGATKVYDSTA